ncbi:MAG: aminoacyl-tRNA hydrolase [Geodermatophilaceae bacterium]|nr:aminoacyl-tRNA hydrolase [Geodermatophilaceae bacterium]
MLPVRAGRLVVPEDELTERFSRSSGPGGQSVNTTDSRVELVWDFAGSRVLTEAQRERLGRRLASRLVDGQLRVVATEYRSQLRNRNAARERLTALLRAALAPPPPARRQTRPTYGSVQRRLAGKRQRSEVKRARGRPAGDD